MGETNYKKKFLLQQSDFILPQPPFDSTQFNMPKPTNTNFKLKASNGFQGSSIKSN